MLNPPLSVLPDEVLSYIVDHVAALSSSHKDLRALCVVDRAFTRACQKWIFNTLLLDAGSMSKTRLIKTLQKMEGILFKRPSHSHFIRVVYLQSLTNNTLEWILANPNFITNFKMLALSPVPPYELRLRGLTPMPLLDCSSLVSTILHSFMPYTLTTLHLDGCKNVSLALFAILPRLKTLYLNFVEAEQNIRDENLSDFGTEVPSIEYLQYHASHTVIQHMVSPPPTLSTPIISWSNLRVLRLSSQDEGGPGCLQSVLRAACHSLQELYLDIMHTVQNGIQVPLSGLINLESVTKLRIFSIYMVINCDGEFDVVKDVNTVLRIIPESNQLFHIAFDFSILSKGKNILPGCMNQDWAGLVEQIKRLSADRYLELDIKTTVSAGLFGEKKIDEENIYNFIKEIMAPLSQCPQICQHIWDSTCWGRGMAPLPLGQSRMRCKRWAT